MTDLVIREPVKVIADIINSELTLQNFQIVLENQKFDIPNMKGMVIVISYIDGWAIGNNNYFNPTTLKEIQQVAMQHTIQIDLLSYDETARTRKEEVIMALNSVYSQQQQEANMMQIARIPGRFLNASELEETARLNRFLMTIMVKSVYTKQKDADSYFTDFAGKLATDYDPDFVDFKNVSPGG